MFLLFPAVSSVLMAEAAAIALGVKIICVLNLGGASFICDNETLVHNSTCYHL